MEAGERRHDGGHQPRRPAPTTSEDAVPEQFPEDTEGRDPRQDVLASLGVVLPAIPAVGGKETTRTKRKALASRGAEGQKRARSTAGGGVQQDENVATSTTVTEVFRSKEWADDIVASGMLLPPTYVDSRGWHTLRTVSSSGLRRLKEGHGRCWEGLQKAAIVSWCSLRRTVTSRDSFSAGVTEQDVFVKNLVHAAIPKEATCKAANAGSLQTIRVATAQKKLEEIKVSCFSNAGEGT